MKQKSTKTPASGHWVKRDAKTGQFYETTGKVSVVRNVTMPNGNTIRVVRKDTLERALTGTPNSHRKG
ncbi:hypothetical protein LJR228_003399 [Mesorhizobium caraganae]